MKYRQEAAGSDDHQFGRAGVFLTDTPQAVAQAVKTRLLLSAGEWFLDLDEGTQYDEVLGYNTQDSRDLAIRERILETIGVIELTEYRSSVSADRRFVVVATVSTIYGNAPVTLEF